MRRHGNRHAGGSVEDLSLDGLGDLDVRRSVLRPHLDADVVERAGSDATVGMRRDREADVDRADAPVAAARPRPVHAVGGILRIEELALPPDADIQLLAGHARMRQRIAVGRPAGRRAPLPHAAVFRRDEERKVTRVGRQRFRIITPAFDQP